jgi:hypothetical protein
MKTPADKARAAALSAEVKKIAWRQTKDGMVLSLELHPAEVPDALALAPLGTRYQMVLVELAEDGTPVSRPAARAPKTQVRSMLVATEAIDLAAAAGDRARVRSVLLAKDVRFQRWANAADEDEAAQYIRDECRIDSRREIAAQLSARQAFEALEARYREQTGLRAEAR